MKNSPQSDPHADSPVFAAGPPPTEAAATVVLVHGRGATAESILMLHDELGLETTAALAPQAADSTWYPQSFLAPIAANQPFLDSALRKIETIVSGLLSQNIPSRKIALLGFSQGACLVAEFAARHPRRYGAIMALTGGLVGPAGTPREYAGSFDGTPIFLGSGDPDSHVPFERVRETAAVLEKMGAKVDLRRYPGLPHGMNDEEIQICRTLISAIIEDAS